MLSHLANLHREGSRERTRWIFFFKEKKREKRSKTAFSKGWKDHNNMIKFVYDNTKTTTTTTNLYLPKPNPKRYIENALESLGNLKESFLMRIKVKQGHKNFRFIRQHFFFKSSTISKVWEMEMGPLPFSEHLIPDCDCDFDYDWFVFSRCWVKKQTETHIHIIYDEVL